MLDSEELVDRHLAVKLMDPGQTQYHVALVSHYENFTKSDNRRLKIAQNIIIFKKN